MAADPPPSSLFNRRANDNDDSRLAGNKAAVPDKRVMIECADSWQSLDDPSLHNLCFGKKTMRLKEMSRRFKAAPSAADSHRVREIE